MAADLTHRYRIRLQEKETLSMHPVIEGDKFCWARGVWDKNLLQKIQNASAVILPQTVESELYYLCRKLCPRVFPNYDLRFRWQGKVGDTLAFWAHKIKHPQTLVFPKVETFLGDHPDMGLKVPDLPQYPFVLKGALGGEGNQVWLIDNSEDLQERLQAMLQNELHGISGFIIQEFLPALERDLRVVVIGNRIASYWRRGHGFYHNIAQGGEIDAESDPELQEIGREKVRQFCTLSGINLAAFDLVFLPDDDDPFFLEINYTFGRRGLGGSEEFYNILREEVELWLQETV